MGSDAQTPDLAMPDPGVLLGADSRPDPPKGKRAAEIRYLHDKYPELSNSALARRVGCDESNVRQVLRSYLRAIPISDIDEFREDKALILESIQHRTLASITDRDIANSSFSQRIVATAIMEDKIRLMRGQPTSIHVHALVDVLDALRMRDSEE